MTAPLSEAESAIALAAVVPLSRRAARERQSVAEPTVVTPVEPFIDEAPAPIIADVPAVRASSDALDELIDAPSANVDGASLTEPFIADAATVSAGERATAKPAADDDVDAFERASRAFRQTGSVPTVSAGRQSFTHRAPATDSEVRVDAGPVLSRRRPRRVRKVVTVGATVGVMGLAGLLAVSMTLPAEAVAAVQGTPGAATSLVSASSPRAGGADADEIQAFVAPSGVENESLARADDFSTVSLVEVAAEQGINYSGEVFTNDPDAAIQWPFLVGVGMSYGYGMRSGRLHEGIDFVPGNGAPIQAIADGTVRIATEQGGAYGVTVYIDHVIDGEVITSHYSHMQYGSLQVKAGDKVTVGTIVGKTGNTGRSYGAHLHFELIVNGATIDPMPWLKANAGRSSLTTEE